MKDLRILTRTLILLVASAGPSACDPGDGGGSTVDAAPPPDASCTTWYPDRDGDHFGDDGSSGEVACEHPAGTVAIKGDCDDASKFRHPLHPEVCDGVDNNCDGHPEAACPNDCAVVASSSGARYLFCTGVTTHHSARTVCQQQLMDLAHVNSEEENLLLQARLGFGLPYWLGGSDEANEGIWRWHGGELFWNGGPAGMPVSGVFSHWDVGQPANANDDLDCAAMAHTTHLSSGRWHVHTCSNPLPFICERAPG